MKQEDVLTSIDRAYAMVVDICQGRKRWEMRIPARPDRDSDLVIAKGLSDARKFIEAASEKDDPQSASTNNAMNAIPALVTKFIEEHVFGIRDREVLQYFGRWSQEQHQ